MDQQSRALNPSKKSVPHPATDWKARAIDAVKRRDKDELEIAAALREGLEQLGEKKWLDFCERTWGWSRSTAYNHLNPQLLAKDRARKQDAAATSRTLDVIAGELNELQERAQSQMLDEMGLPREDRGRPTLHTCKACGEQYDKSVKGAFYKHLDDCSTLKKRRAEMEARDAAWEGETRRLKADPKWSSMTELEQMHAINRQLPPTPEQEAEWEQIKVNQVGHSLDNLEANIEHLIREEARFTPAYYDRLQCLAGQLTAFLARRVS